MKLKALDKLGWLSSIVLVVCIVSGAILSYLLTQLDAIVNVQLYNFGLQFSEEWAGPYWTSLHLIYVFVGIPMVLSILVLALSFVRMRKQRLIHFLRRKGKPEMEVFVKVPETEVESETEEEQAPVGKEQTAAKEEHLVEQKQQETLPAAPTVEKPEVREDNVLVISCPSCGKVFSRPLIMLDFSGGKTRLVNICPYCNHKLGEVPEEKDEKKGAGMGT